MADIQEAVIVLLICNQKSSFFLDDYMSNVKRVDTNGPLAHSLSCPLTTIFFYSLCLQFLLHSLAKQQTVSLQLATSWLAWWSI